MVLIHEKISALLEQRRLKKRDLARALGVSPQTATDICKGRSAITLPHLRNLVAFFELRADFWLDDLRLLPGEHDRINTFAGPGNDSQPGTAVTGWQQLRDPERLLRLLRQYVQRNRVEFLQQCPELSNEERRVLGLLEVDAGSVGRVTEA